jgi:hypothetical protein
VFFACVCDRRQPNSLNSLVLKGIRLKKQQNKTLIMAFLPQPYFV